MHAVETDPEDGARDASKEVIHHSILNNGWSKSFPDTFSSEDKESSIYKAWKTADDKEFYVYNDPTCNDDCKVTEFFNLATATYFGESGAPALDLASDEMRLKTRKEMVEKLPDVVEIIENGSYGYPTDHWPNGTYPFADEQIMYFGLASW